MSCELVKKGIVKRKGRAIQEGIIGNNTIYSCLGYVDPRNDEPLEECCKCEKFACNVADNWENIVKKLNSKERNLKWPK